MKMFIEYESITQQIVLPVKSLLQNAKQLQYACLS
jgi:hypothetical protein